MRSNNNRSGSRVHVRHSQQPGDYIKMGRKECAGKRKSVSRWKLQITFLLLMGMDGWMEMENGKAAKENLQFARLVL